MGSCTNVAVGTSGSFFVLFSHEILKAESSAKREDEDGDVGGLEREEEEC